MTIIGFTINAFIELAILIISVIVPTLVIYNFIRVKMSKFNHSYYMRFNELEDLYEEHLYFIKKNISKVTTDIESNNYTKERIVEKLKELDKVTSTCYFERTKK